MSDPRDRALGCFIGLVAGDAVGTTLEFAPRDTRPPIDDMVGGGPFKLKPGGWTDDTSMALCLAESLLAARKLDPPELMQRFSNWYMFGHNSHDGRCFDIGNTVRAALEAFQNGGDALAGTTDAGSAGNGSIMRLAPVPVFFRRSRTAAEAAAVLQSRTTHGAPEAIDACVLLTRILLDLIEGKGRAALTQHRAGLGSPRISAIAAGVWRGRPRAAIKSTGYVVDTLEAALWAVEGTASFRDAVLAAANLGDDADTVAAVAGQIAGALYGLDGIPPEWRERLAWSTRLHETAARLFDEAA